MIRELPTLQEILKSFSKKDLWNRIQEKNQRIAELEEQLKNAIVPKFKQYQQVFYISNGYIFSKWWYECECQDGIIVGRYLHSKSEIVYYKKPKDLVFATKEEAEAKLKELQSNDNWE